MTTEGSPMYSATLMAPASVPQPTASAAESTASPPSVTTTPAAAVAAAVAAAHPQPQQLPVDTKAPPPVPQPPAPHMQPMAAAAAAAAFGQYPAGMVFTAPDAATAAVLEDQPTYVNPKQYARILKRRESRKKQTGTDVTSYTPRKRSYMHESRHKHAMQRRRGPGGRFLSKEEREDLARQQIKEQAAAGQ